ISDRANALSKRLRRPIRNQPRGSRILQPHRLRHALAARGCLVSRSALEDARMRNRVFTLSGMSLAVALLVACGSSYSTDSTGGNTTTTIKYKATLTGGAERPNANTSVGTGTFTGTLDPATGVLTYSITYSGLGANSTLSHIHGPGSVDQA